MFCSKVILCVLLCSDLSLVLGEEYLFKRGSILYKNRSYKMVSLETKKVMNIDNHLVPDAVSIRVVGEIKHLYKGAIKNLFKLKNLSLPGCKIEKISPGAFQNLQKLKNLHIQDNDLEVIEENVFNYLNVENLYLQRNKIYIIRSSALDNMKLLKKIFLNNNKLTKWDSLWFKNTPNLNLLYVRRNKISEIPARAFYNLRTSHKMNGLTNTSIYLSKNQISFIHPQAFEDIYVLQELWLDRNKIEKIDNAMFAHITVLERLYLHKNRVSEIDRHAFKELKHMSELNLSFNRNLSCIDYEIVYNVKRVNVNNNDIYCSCLYNLKKKINENRLSHKVLIIHRPCLDDLEETPDTY